MLQKFLRPPILPTSADWGVLALRLGSGLMLMTHGYAKLGRLLEGKTSFADPLGLGEELSLYLVIIAEFVCSILIVLGLLTRAALIPLLINMSVIVLIVHSSDPFGDKELPLLFLTCFLALLLTGPGRYSLDQQLFK